MHYTIKDKKYEHVNGRCVVIGAGGFIGKSLCEGLLHAGHKVLAIGPNIKIEHLNLLKYEDKIFSSDQLKNILCEKDIIFDVAGSTTPAMLNSFSNSSFLNEIALHSYIIDASIRAKSAKIVFISSGGTVYGDPKCSFPIIENHPTAPISPYGVVKLQVEEMFKAASRAGLIETIVARLSNPYGPGQINKRAQGLIAVIFEDFISSRASKIWGDGSAIRDYIYIDDARDALIESLQLPGGSVCHVSSGTGISTLDAVIDISQVLGMEIKTFHDYSHSIGVKYNVLSNKYLKSNTRWKQATSWKDGLDKTAAWWLNIK